MSWFTVSILVCAGLQGSWQVNSVHDVVEQEAKMLEQMADGGAFEGTPEITPQPGPFIPELTAGPTLLATKDAFQDIPRPKFNRKATPSEHTCARVGTHPKEKLL